MTDNSTLPATNDKIRDIDKGGVKTQVLVIDKGGAGAESLVADGNGLPVSLPVDADGAVGKVKLFGSNYDEGYNEVYVAGDGSIFVSLNNIISAATMDESSQSIAEGVLVTPKFAVISCSGSGNNTVVAAVPDYKIRVLALSLSASAAVNAKFQSGAGGTNLTGLRYMATNGTWDLPYNKLGWFETGVSALLNLNLSGAIPVGGCITYIEV
jgi:hypothetical protein